MGLKIVDNMINETMRMSTERNTMIIKKELMKVMKRISRSDDDFIKYFKSTFTITEICEILKIKRNRYNYLKRIKKLDQRIKEMVMIHD